MTTATNKQKAQAEAVALAVAGLRKKDFSGDMTLRVFGRTLKVTLPDFEVTVENSVEPVGPADQILTLHYLLCDTPARPTGEWIAFRDFPGGQFYLEPYRLRTVKPLAGHFQNDLDSLRSALDRFDWTPVETGDLGARIQTINDFHLTLVYRRGDEDFEPEADILFDAGMKRIFCTEDATVLAARVCRGLIGQSCVSCSGCGMCETRAYSNS